MCPKDKRHRKWSLNIALQILCWLNDRAGVFKLWNSPISAMNGSSQIAPIK